MSDVEHIRSQLEESRKELLDLTLRNSLLNYRPSRSRGAEVADERSGEVFRIVVTEGKAMRFRPAPEDRTGDIAVEPVFSGVAPAEDDGVDAADAESPAPRHVDRWLQTPYDRDRLQTRLIHTARAARTMLEEKGVNVLYLALGMLRWIPDDGTGRERLAPLVLVPVRLERKNVASHYRVTHSGEDAGTNLSLVEKLRADFGIELPAAPEDAEDLDPLAYLAGVETAIAGLSGWAVEPDRIVLSFFSFGRFLMFHDLGADAWPEGRKPWDHDILYDLFESGLRERPVPDTGGDARRLEVVDADSSQQEALARAARESVVVIQGPPGTGKSQTITNLVAAAVARGERVLFVAEKMAALEVVKRRLDLVGIGDACLELHSHKSSKRRVLREIGRTLELGCPAGMDDAAEDAALEEARQRLDAYCTAVNEPVGETGVTPHAAMGALIEMGERAAALPRFETPDLARWTPAAYAARERLVGELESARAALGEPRQHLFWGAGLTELLPQQREVLAALTEAADRARRDLVAAAEETVAVLGSRGCPDATVLRRNIRALEHLLLAPDLDGVSVASKRWHTRREEIARLLEIGAAAGALRARHEDDFLPGAWDDDVVETRRDLNHYGRKWWRLFSGRYRRARRHLAGICRRAPPRGVDASLVLCDAILELRRLDNDLIAHARLGEKLFGDGYRGRDSNWKRLGEVAAWCEAAHEVTHASEASARLLAVASEGFEKAAVDGALERARASLSSSHATFEELEGALDWSAVRGESLAALGFEDLALRLATWKARLPGLHELVTFNRLSAECDEQGLHEVAAAAVTWTGAADGLGGALRASRMRAVADRAFEERSELARFDRAVHEDLAARFRQLDTRGFRRNRARIALEHWRRLPGHAAGGQLGLLRHEVRKKSRHLALRVLLRRAGRAVQAVKPVFMMSPMSIATYLAADGPQFDVVVFDEASQVRPVDALGAVLRGRRLVVVGDTRQLPPTAFFDRLTRAEGGDDEAEPTVTKDVESVLTLCLARGARPGMLRWHYRSRHPSLIAVSNRVFYGDRLVVFPSPQAAADPSPRGLGLVLRHLPDTVYEPGEATNAGEARAVAEAVLAHARSAPSLSLGVAAFSIRQKACIEGELERLRVEDPSCESFFRAHPHEPFFVKNLENVQGDERDVIFISIGYGRQADGKVSMNFGPLNQSGGERRLNVLVTRSRRRCEVFTNLTSDDIDLDRTAAAGVRALEEYLQFAESGRLAAGDDEDDAGAEPPFEAAVHRALRGAGVDVDARVGCGGFRLDLAARDATEPGRYVAGVQCDGAVYRQGRSVRDRDRLRRQVLEALGWRLQQVWSVAWFRDPDGELERVRDAVTAGGAGPGAADRSVEPLERDAERPPPGLPPPPAYEVADVRMRLGEKELHEVTPGVLSGWIEKVVAVESPVHEQEVARRVRESTDTARDGSRIREAFAAGLARAIEKGLVRERGGFLWTPGMETPPLRDRSDLPAPRRTIDLIAPEELDAALLRAVEESFGIAPDEAVRAALRHVGMRRASDEAEAAVRARIEGLLLGGRLRYERGELAL